MFPVVISSSLLKTLTVKFVILSLFFNSSILISGTTIFKFKYKFISSPGIIVLFSFKMISFCLTPWFVIFEINL